jgi:DNA-directed RNA polymerase sigma subunit (sigma70/sigma32)
LRSRIPPVTEWNKSVSQLSHIIDEWIFDEKHRDIVRRRLLHGEDLYDIADSYHLSYERTRDIYYECRRQVFSHKDD